MELLDSYLKTVRRFLPNSSKKDDIVAELSEDLLSQMEEKQSSLGRPLLESEQMELLHGYGNPMDVARRYREDRRSLAIGWELIGPELFPGYVLFLGMNLTIALLAVVVVLLVLGLPITLRTFVIPLLAQIVCVTLVFTILNFVRRHFASPWLLPGASVARMLPVARWYSASGMVACGLLALWWLAVPRFPSLLLGRSAAQLELTPAFHRFHPLLLALVLAGVAQRVVSFFRPSWTWLVPVSRALIDGLGAWVTFAMFRSQPLVALRDGAGNLERARAAATSTTNLLEWGVLSWLWIYLGISAAFYAWYAVPHIRRLFRTRSGAAQLVIS